MSNGLAVRLAVKHAVDGAGQLLPLLIEHVCVRREGQANIAVPEQLRNIANMRARGK